MNRIAGIVVAVAGLLLAVLSIARVLPGLTGAGVVFILFGGLIIGLSFISRPETEGGEAMSTPNTLLNIFFSPSETFASLRRHPRFFVALLIITVLSSAYGFLFLQRLGPERVVNYTIDKTLEMPMVANNEEARKSVEAGRAQAIADSSNTTKQVIQVGSTFAGWTVLMCVLALVYLLFALAMGGKMNFWQAFSVAVYASLPYTVIKFVLNTILLYVKDPDSIHPVLGAQTLVQDSLNFLVLPAEHPVLFTVLGSFSLLTLYWVWLTATGIKNAGEKVTGTIAWSAAISVFAIMVLLGVAMAFLFPNFIS